MSPNSTDRVPHEIGPTDVSARAAATSPAADARLPRFLSATGTPDVTALRRLKVAVIGVGAVGRNLALHLARLMIAELWIVDPGRFKPESLLTQAISPNDVGQAKAGNTARACKAISAGTRVSSFAGPFERLATTALADVDMALLATDNLRAEVQVGQRCQHLGQPLMQASVQGDMLVAQVRFFANRSREGPCLACGFSAEEWDHLSRSTSYSCEGGPGRASANVTTEPTTSVSSLCSLAADLAMTQLLRHTLGLGAPVTDTLLEYSGYTHRTTISPLGRNSRCPAEHVIWQRQSLPRPLGDYTLRELADSACLGEDGETDRVGFTVGDLSFVGWAVCGSGHVHPLQRFAALGEDVEPCPECGASLRPHPFHSHRPVSGQKLQLVLDRPLGALVRTVPSWVVLRCADRAVLFRCGVARPRQDDDGGT